ncbi:hypothetical protein [Phenylobacterium sp.]|uniref:hypothetical protein n=1 Tax=Phenylobacterium sp. TaxID=1871053 RepID=UPI0035B3D33A
MKRRHILAVTAAAALIATAARAEDVVRLDAAAQARLGVVTAKLAATTLTAQAQGFARVLDPLPLASLEADLAAAEAAAAASRAEAARAKALNAADHAVSNQAAEAAQALARADQAKLALLRRRLELEWGTGLAGMGTAERGRLEDAVAAGEAALVRIDAARPQAAPAQVELRPAGGPAITARVLGPLRTADPRLQSPGWLALVRGPAARNLAAGQVVPAVLAGGSAGRGVIVPRSALMRGAGETFVYVRRDAGAFERRVLAGGQSTPNGLFVTGGVRPGEAVVVEGAAKLLAAGSGGGEID